MWKQPFISVYALTFPIFVFLCFVEVRGWLDEIFRGNAGREPLNRIVDSQAEHKMYKLSSRWITK